MAQANMNNFNTFARLQILTGEVKVIDFMALKELRLEINRIGQNINQVAKLVNTNEFARTEDLEILQEQLETITELVETAIANQMGTVWHGLYKSFAD